MNGHGRPEGGLTVGEVAERLGVTVRTLHHWDAIGLAAPGGRTASGYRLYGAADIVRLQRILIYREVGVPLDTIKELMDGSFADPAERIRHQLDEVTAKIERLRAARLGLARLLRAHEHGILLTPEQQVEVFGDRWDPDWVRRARERWGGSAQWAEYAENSAGRSPQEWAEHARAMSELEADLVRAHRDGVAPGTAAANALAERHRELFGAYFTLTRERQVLLGRAYEDGEYREHYEGLAAGLAAWLRQVFDANARAHGVDPEKAVWDGPPAP